MPVARPWLPTVLLPLLLLLALTSAAVHANAATTTSPTFPLHSSGKPKHVLFVSIPLPGHLNPLLVQARVLARRGWHVSISTTASGHSHVQASLKQATQEHPGLISIVPAPPCAAEASRGAVLAAASAQRDFAGGTTSIIQWSFELFTCLFDQSLAYVDGLSSEQRPSVVVSDLVSPAGGDVAKELGVPGVTNCADLLHALSATAVPVADDVPWAFSGSSRHTMGSALLQRALGPLIRVFARTIVSAQLGSVLNARRADRGLAPVDPYYTLRGQPVLVNLIAGIEYPRPVPPLVHMLGPMLADDEPEVSAEEDAWLRRVDVPVVYVSMGTIASLSRERRDALRAMFARGGGGEFRVMWKVRGEPESESDTLKVSNWVSSQVNILRRPEVRVFLSHCGINSVNEAAYHGVLMLCVPIFGDQEDMMQRVVDAGFGLGVHKFDSSVTEIEHKLRTLIHPESATPPHQQHITFAQARDRVQAFTRTHGGVELAADLIEAYAIHGSGLLQQPRSKFSELAEYGLDAAALQVLQALFLGWLFVKLAKLVLAVLCCRCCRGGSAGKTKTQ